MFVACAAASRAAGTLAPTDSTPQSFHADASPQAGVADHRQDLESGVPYMSLDVQANASLTFVHVGKCAGDTVVTYLSAASACWNEVHVRPLSPAMVQDKRVIIAVRDPVELR